MNAAQYVRALLISPDRQIAQQFAATQAGNKCFEIQLDLSAYPASEQQLEAKVRQIRPEVLVIDVATDLALACTLIDYATRMTPPVEVIALHRASNADAVLAALRSGAREFLAAPFDSTVQQAAVTRLRKLIDPAGSTEGTKGKLVAFTSSKPGSGASTLAVQTARALRKSKQRRVAIIDLNVSGGSIAFFLNLDPVSNISALLSTGTRIDHGIWSSVAMTAEGIDVIAAPELPRSMLPDATQLAAILNHARSCYDWVILDLPCAFQRLTLGCLAEADKVFIVSTPDLASLHLTRRAVRTIRQLGFDFSRFGVLLNRMDNRAELSSSELKKLFDCDIDRGLPTDSSGLHSSLVQGKPLDASSGFGKAVQGLADKLCQSLGDSVPAAGAVPERRAILAGA